jgi:hypothetical protein
MPAESPVPPDEEKHGGAVGTAEKTSEDVSLLLSGVAVTISTINAVEGTVGVNRATLTIIASAVGGLLSVVIAALARRREMRSGHALRVRNFADAAWDDVVAARNAGH